MHSFRTQALAVGKTGIAAAAGAVLAACSVPAPETHPLSMLLVLPLEVTGSVDQPDFVGKAIAESLTRNLEPVPDLRVVDAATPIASGTATLSGSFRRGDDRSCLEVRARLPGRGEPVWSVVRCSGSASIPDLIDDVTRGCLEALGRKPPALYPYIGRVEGGAEMAASPLLEAARERLRNGEYAALASIGAELIGQFPSDAAARVIRAWALALAWDASPSEDRLSALRQTLDDLTRVDPNSPYDDMIQAHVYRTSGAPDVARQLYSRILARSDLMPAARSWVLRQRSFTHAQAGREEAARGDAEEAVRLDPANPQALVALSRTLETAGRLEDAFARATEALAIEPDSWRHLQRVGLVAMRAGSHDLAAHYLRRACENGGTQEACANLAVLLHRAGRADEALRVASQAEERAASPWGAYNLACLWALRGEHEAAIGALRRAFEAGFADVLISTDPDLSGLRGDRRFEAEVEKVLDRIQTRRRIATAVFPWQG